MEKLIRFEHESQSNSVALFKAVSIPICCPQIFAGHDRGADFNLVTDVGSRAEETQKHCFSEEFTANGTYRLGKNSLLLTCAYCAVVFFIKEALGRTLQQNWAVIGPASIWYWAFNRRSLMRCHLKRLSIPWILRRWHLKSPQFSSNTKYFTSYSN